MSLVQALKNEQKQKQMAAGESYAAMLAAAGTLDDYRKLLAGDDPEQLGKLKAAMGTLGLADADVESDLAALADHAAAKRRVLTDEQRAAFRAAAVDGEATVRAEAREAFTAWVDALPTPWLARVGRALWVEVLDSFNGATAPAERARLAALARMDHWGAAATGVETQERYAIQDSFAASNELLRLEAAHPRVLGGTAAVAAVAGTAAVV